MGFMLKVVGADPDDFTDDEWDKAIDLLTGARDGQIRAVHRQRVPAAARAGNIAACEAWSGDVIQLQFDNPNIKFVVPEEGLSLWSDNMMVPNLATHKTNAEIWMNYYYDPSGGEARGLGQLHLPGRRAPGRRWRSSTPHSSTTR